MKRKTKELIVIGIILAGGAGAWGYELCTKSVDDQSMFPRKLAQPTEQIQEIKDALVSREVIIGKTVFQCNKEFTIHKGDKALLCFPSEPRSK